MTVVIANTENKAMIDVQSILIAVLSSGVTGSAIAFVLKRVVERSIDHRFRMVELEKQSELTQVTGNERRFSSKAP
jgi:hypothetical protein